MLNLVKSHSVINAALLDPKIKSLRMIAALKDPIEWLQAVLKVEFPEETEVLEISLSGGDPAEMAQVVNAIQNAFLEQVVNSEVRERKSRQESLKTIQADLCGSDQDASRDAAETRWRGRSGGSICYGLLQGRGCRVSLRKSGASN